MSERVYVGLDIGSSGIRAVAVTAEGRQGRRAQRDRASAPMSLTDFERDLDPHGIWRACTEVLSEVGAGRQVAALGVAACRQSLIVTDAQGEMLFASGNDDVRASLAGASVEAESDRSVLAVTGHTPAMIHWPGKLRWLVEERPDVCDAAARITTLEGWVAGRLGADPVLTDVAAVETGAWDLAAGEWAMELIPNWAQPMLPEVKRDPTPARIRADIGLSPDCVVAAGWPDSHAAEFATRGVTSDGDCVAAGWSTAILRPIDIHNPDAQVWRGKRIGGGLVAEANAGDGGTGYGWLRAQHPSGELTMEAVGDEPAADMGVFVLSGLRVMDWNAPGLSVSGMLSPAPFVFGTPTASTLGTAVLEDSGVCDSRQPTGTGCGAAGGRAGAADRGVRASASGRADRGKRDGVRGLRISGAGRAGVGCRTGRGGAGLWRNGRRRGGAGAGRRAV